jgi:hypothetical protein
MKQGPISIEKVELLSKAFHSRMSANRAARLAGVSEATARAYRDAEDGLPADCGCGRPLRHRGPCAFRRKTVLQYSCGNGVCGTE